MKTISLKNVTHDELKVEMEKFFNFEYGQFEEAVNYLLKNKDQIGNNEYISMTGDRETVTVDTIGVTVPDRSFDVELKEGTIIKLGTTLKLSMKKF